MTGESSAGLSFGARGQEYERFRIGYAPELFHAIAEAASGTRRDLAIDLGSGTGISTRPLLERFALVTAVEPDARMAAGIGDDPRLTVVVSRAEDFDAAASSADLVTCGTAFYWMEGPDVIRSMARWLRPDGLAAVFRYALPILPMRLQEVLETHFSSFWNAHRHPRLSDEDYSWRCFRDTPHFETKSIALVENCVTMTATNFVGFFASTSYVGAYLRSLDDPAAYLRGFEADVVSAVGQGSFSADFPTELILALGPRL